MPDEAPLVSGLALLFILSSGCVVSGDATGVLLLPDMLEDDESELELVLLVLLPQDVMNMPSERLNKLIFRIFMIVYF